jgi:hypothetical protein
MYEDKCKNGHDHDQDGGGLRRANGAGSAEGVVDYRKKRQRQRSGSGGGGQHRNGKSQTRKRPPGSAHAQPTREPPEGGEQSHLLTTTERPSSPICPEMETINGTLLYRYSSPRLFLIKIYFKKILYLNYFFFILTIKLN